MLNLIRLAADANLKDYAKALDCVCYSHKASNPLQLLQYDARSLPAMANEFISYLDNLTYL